MYMNYEKLFDCLSNAYSKSNKKRFIVSIAGCAQSGKTTLAKKIKNDLSKRDIDCIIFSLDNWLLGLDERKGNETVRERFQYKKISEAINQIKNGNKVYTPIYDPKTRLIVSKKSLNPIYINEGICIIDGVVALDIKELRNISDFNIFVDIDDDIRKNRLMKFYVGYKSCSVNGSEKLINARELEEVPAIKKTVNYADVIYKSGKYEFNDTHRKIDKFKILKDVKDEVIKND